MSTSENCLRATLAWLLAAIVALTAQPSRAERLPLLDRQLAVLLKVEKEGEGNVAASQAWQHVAAAQAEALPQVLSAIDRAGPLAANWIATAAEQITERTRAAGERLPTAALKSFVLDTAHAPRARRLAFEWLRGDDEKTAEAIVPGFLHDPSPELRREAVAKILNEAATKKADQAGDDALRALYRQALSGACDLDQVKAVKAELEKLGEKVDLARHFGFLLNWKVIGPFDNSGGRGFDVAYPPEQEINLAATYDGKPRDGGARRLEWRDTTTQDEFGFVDLNTVLVRENGVVGYAWTEFWSDRERPAELRFGRDNAAKIWLNGQLIEEHRVYHSGIDMDQYTGRGTLQQGRNRILLKILQNEQKEEWAQGWGFQLRVCDSTGQAIHPVDAARSDQ
ncbi:MAG TPA: hypothetical protein VG125_33320 [Pirellulales bacterium]|jgi:hypothetical protein|nr:hypothetical protein [Pirellulales bacterium]